MLREIHNTVQPRLSRLFGTEQNKTVEISYSPDKRGRIPLNGIGM